MRKEPSMCLYVCVSNLRWLSWAHLFSILHFSLFSTLIAIVHPFYFSIFFWSVCDLCLFVSILFLFFFFVNSWFRRTDVLLFSMCVSYSYAICCVRFECVYRAGCGCWVSLSLHVVACAFAITLNFSETERSSESLLCQSFILITKEKEKEKN